MSADTEFPTGWVAVNAVGPTLTPTVLIPAITNVTHVLDSFDSIFIATALAAVFDCSIFLSSSDGVFTNFQLGFHLAPTGPAKDTVSDSFRLAAGPSASLTITWNVAVPATGFGMLSIKGHDL